MPYAEGDLVKGQSTPAIYLIEGGTRRWIPDPATLESRWSWSQVQTLPDAEVDAIPMGTPIPSVIQPGPYPEGTLLVASAPEVYVIMGGERRWIPDPVTFEANGYSWADIQRISDPEMNAIPLGSPLTPVRRIEANVETDLQAGHFMTTGANLLSDGRLTAVTRTRTVTWFGGFTGGVQVVMGDVNGVAIGNTSMHSFGVDGTWIGTSDRTENWSEYIDPAIANRTASLTITHAWTPKVNMEEMVRIAIEVGKLIVILIQELNREGNAGGGTGPYSPPPA
jgi:hypothetical protein